MPRIRIRNITSTDLVIVPGVPVIPRHSTVTTRVFLTSELESVQRVLTQLRTLKVIEYQIEDQEDHKIDNVVELATVQDIYNLLSGVDGSGGGSGNWTTGPGRRIYQEVPSGPINGVNTTFAVSVPFITTVVGREVVYLNGVAQARGVGSDYVIAESVPLGGYDLIVFAVPPKTNDHVSVDYIPA